MKKIITIPMPERRMNEEMMQSDPPYGGSLTERARLANAIYNVLLKIAPEDIDGVKRAYVDVTPTGASIETTTETQNPLKTYYGIEGPVSVADMSNPFPLVPQNEGPIEFTKKKVVDRSLLRQVLRRVVDEV